MTIFLKNIPGSLPICRLVQIWFLAITAFLFVVTISCKEANPGGETDGVEVLESAPFKDLSKKIRNSPENSSLYIERGQLLSQHQLHKLAAADFNKAWHLNPDERTGLLSSANLFLAGNDKEAIDFLLACSRKFPSNTEFPRRLGEAYQQLGKTRDALAQYDTILHHDSGNFEAWYEKGVLLAEAGDTSNATRALETAYSIQPLQHYGISLANLYAETRNNKVLDLCNELIAKDSARELTDAIFVKGIYYANTGQKDKALEQFEHCINQDWKFTDAYIEKGILLYTDQNIDEALKTFALAAKVSNTDPDAYYWMARCFESIGKKDEAFDNYRRALALDRHFVEAAKGLERVK